MWHPFQKKAGHDQIERLIQALTDQNALLRAQIELQGGTLPKVRPVSLIAPRRRTEADVFVQTRESLKEVELQEEMKLAKPHLRPDPSPGENSGVSKGPTAPSSGAS